MSKNLDTLRNGYENFAKGNIPAVLAVFDPKIEWTEAEGFPYAGTYVGHEAVVNNVFMKLGTEWDGYTVKTNEFIDAGDRIVVLGKYSGTYKATGKSFEADFAHVWTMRDGIAKKFYQYADTALVQEALQG
ncbi:MAG: nuclear transport factor 2 family protein [bacterium]